MKWRVMDRRQIETARFVRDMTVAVLVVVFSALFIWYSRYTGQGFWVYWAPFFLTVVAFALGVPVYRAQRRAMVAPGELPPYPSPGSVGGHDEVIDPAARWVTRIH
jgi:APA family basic amino acid/polyamine antiporter